MKHAEFESREDAERFLAEHPMWVFFHLDMGLLDGINQNSREIAEAVILLLMTLYHLIYCLAFALYHLMRMALYPLTKALIVRKVCRELKAKATGSGGIKNESVRGF